MEEKKKKKRKWSKTLQSNHRIVFARGCYNFSSLSFSSSCSVVLSQLLCGELGGVSPLRLTQAICNSAGAWIHHHSTGPLENLLCLPKQTPGPLSSLNTIPITCINFSDTCSQLRNAEGITSWAFFLGASNKPYPASTSPLLDCIYMQRWFSASKGFGKTVQRLPKLQYSILVTPICRGDDRCLLFISKNKMEMTTRMQTSCCCCSNSQHLLPSRDSIFKISLVLYFWWSCQTLPGAAAGVLTLLSSAFPAPCSSPLSLCSTLKHSHTTHRMV